MGSQLKSEHWENNYKFKIAINLVAPKKRNRIKKLSLAFPNTVFIFNIKY